MDPCRWEAASGELLVQISEECMAAWELRSFLRKAGPGSVPVHHFPRIGVLGGMTMVTTTESCSQWSRQPLNVS